jgi:hypothetical protein
MLTRYIRQTKGIKLNIFQCISFVIEHGGNESIKAIMVFIKVVENN